MVFFFFWLGINWDSLVCDFIFFTKLGEFLLLFTQIFFSAPLSPSSLSGTPATCGFWRSFSMKHLFSCTLFHKSQPSQPSLNSDSCCLTSPLMCSAWAPLTCIRVINSRKKAEVIIGLMLFHFFQWSQPALPIIKYLKMLFYMLCLVF